MVGGLTRYFLITQDELIGLTPETIDKSRQLLVLTVMGRKAPAGLDAIWKGIEDLFFSKEPETKSKK
jgi:hypothetical protein